MASFATQSPWPYLRLNFKRKKTLFTLSKLVTNNRSALHLNVLDFLVSLNLHYKNTMKGIFRMDKKEISNFRVCLGNAYFLKI